MLQNAFFNDISQDVLRFKISLENVFEKRIVSHNW